MADEEEVLVATAYKRAAKTIRDAIDNGDLLPGTELPTSKRLAEQEGITQETALKALRLLAAEGYIELVPRKAARVRKRPRTRISVRDRHAYRDGIGYYFDAGAKDWRPMGSPTRGLTVPPPYVADLLGVPRDEDVVVRDRAMGPPGAEVAKQLSTSYLSMSLAAAVPALRAETTGPGGIYDRIEEHFQAPIQWSETVWSRPPTEHEQDALGLPPAMWVMVITRESRITQRDKAIVVEVNETRMSAEEFAVSYTVIRDATAAWPRAERS